MTDEQIRRLPPALQEVILLERRLEAERGGGIHTFELWHRRRRLAVALRGGWGTDHGDDNSRPPAAARAA